MSWSCGISRQLCHSHQRFKCFHYCVLRHTSRKYNGPYNTKHSILLCKGNVFTKTNCVITLPQIAGEVRYFYFNGLYDWRYLLDPGNTSVIEENIRRRKGVGDIQKLLEAWQAARAVTGVATVDDLWEVDREAWHTLQQLAAQIPNTTHPASPIGDENEVVETVGEPPEFTFRPKSVLELGHALAGLKLDQLSVFCGHRSYFLLHDWARLERALVHYSVWRLRALGFRLVTVPDLVRPAVVAGCGFLPNDRQVYRLHEADLGPLCLSGTGEMGLAGLLAGSRWRAEDLPHRLVTVSRCYRAEASEGQADLGIYRVHAFTKVEMFILARPDDSEAAFDEIVHVQRELFADLGLHFRVVAMSSGELGAPACRKVDVEGWMAAKRAWGEISSASHCTDYQSRRLDITYTDHAQGPPRHAHTIVRAVIPTKAFNKMTRLICIRHNET